MQRNIASVLSTMVFGSVAFSIPAWATPQPATDGTATQVTQEGDRFDISGGQLSGDGANLFHSFEDFSLDQQEIANFLSTPNIEHILSRVVGGNPSLIDGLIQVTGGNSNLYLMNPSGIIFGNHASLNVPADFVATTASGIGIGDHWFSAVGDVTYSDLVGTPTTFAFGEQALGAIVNHGNLSVTEGQHLALIAHTLISTGQLNAPNGQVTLATVPENTLVRLQQPGHVLSLELLPETLDSQFSPSRPNELTIPIASLPELLTTIADHATTVTVNPDGSVSLTGSGLPATPVNNGDIALRHLNAGGAIALADQTLALVESQLLTTGPLTLQAGNTVFIRDSQQTPFIAQTGGDLRIQGNQAVDILALNHPNHPIQSGGNLTLTSDGMISTDAHFTARGNVSILDLAGAPGNFISLYDPIISSEGDVEFGDYTGASLMVEARGSIRGGNVVITGPDTTYPILPDWEMVGNVSVETSNFDSTNASETIPTQVLISNENFPTVAVGAIEAFLNLADGTLSALGNGVATEGSAIRTTITAQAGDVITFDWQFFTSEAVPRNDFAIVTLSGASTSTTELADQTFAGGFPVNLVGTGTALDNFVNNPSFTRGTAPQTIAIPIPADGTYTLGLAVLDVTNTFADSALLVENVTPQPLTLGGDRSILAASPSLILRAGVETLQYPANLPQLDVPETPTDFTSPDTTLPGSITIGDITTEVVEELAPAGGPVILTAPGDITTGNIVTGGDSLERPYGGSVTILSGGDVTVRTIDTSGLDGGDITIRAEGTFRATDYFLSNDFDYDATNDDISLGEGGGALPAFQVPTSIAATGSGSGGATVSIEHGSSVFVVGPSFQRDANNNIVYVDADGNILTYTDADGNIVVDEDGYVVFSDESGVTDTLYGIPLFTGLDLDGLPADASYSVGAITSNQANEGAVVSIRDRPFIADESGSIGGGRIEIVSNYVPPVDPGDDTPGDGGGGTVDPGDPTDPIDPTDPTDPINPVDPIDPDNPGNPDPGNPDPGETPGDNGGTPIPDDSDTADNPGDGSGDNSGSPSSEEGGTDADGEDVRPNLLNTEEEIASQPCPINPAFAAYQSPDNILTIEDSIALASRSGDYDASDPCDRTLRNQEQNPGDPLSGQTQNLPPEDGQQGRQALFADPHAPEEQLAESP